MLKFATNISEFKIKVNITVFSSAGLRIYQTNILIINMTNSVSCGAVNDKIYVPSVWQYL